MMQSESHAYHVNPPHSHYAPHPHHSSDGHSIHHGAASQYNDMQSQLYDFFATPPQPHVGAPSTATLRSQPLDSEPLDPEVAVVPTVERELEPASTSPKPDQHGFFTLKFPIFPRPRATRASAPKRRTGCVTCKKRHLKCDERKPGCERCTRWRGFCGGYVVPDPKRAPANRVTKTAKRTSTDSKKNLHKPESYPSSTDMAEESAPSYLVVPGTSTAASSPSPRFTPPGDNYFLATSPAPTTPTSTSSHSSPQSYDDHPHAPNSSEDNLDSWYLHTATLSGAIFTNTLWRNVIPILSSQHLGINHATLAITTMSRSFTLPQSSASSTGDYDIALAHYGAAIAEVARTPTAGRTNLRAAVLCYLLFICFESMHGDKRASLAHAHNGRRLMEALMRSSPGEGEYINGVSGEQVDGELIRLCQAFAPSEWGLLDTREKR